MDNENMKSESDPVNHPNHYNQYQGFEVIEVCEQLRSADGSGNFNRGNAFKYLARAGWKNPSKEVEDLEKAVFYLNREIERVKVMQNQKTEAALAEGEQMLGALGNRLQTAFDEGREEARKAFEESVHLARLRVHAEQVSNDKKIIETESENPERLNSILSRLSRYDAPPPTWTRVVDDRVRCPICSEAMKNSVANVNVYYCDKGHGQVVRRTEGTFVQTFWVGA